MAKKKKATGDSKATAGAQVGWPRDVEVPRALDDVWLAGAVPLPERLDLAGLYEVALVAGRDTIRMATVGLAPLDDDAVRAALEEAIYAPVPPLTPARPRVVVVPHARVAAALAALAAQHHFTLEVKADLDLGAVFDGLSVPEGVEPLTGATLLGVPRPVEADFAEAAARFARTRPWVRFPDEQTFLVTRRGAPLDYPCAVTMGGSGLLRGLALYRSVAELELMRAAGPSPEAPEIPPTLMFELERGAETQAEIVEAFRRRGHPVVDDGYPFAMQVDRGVGVPITDEPLARALVFVTTAVAAWLERPETLLDDAPLAVSVAGDVGEVRLLPNEPDDDDDDDDLSPDALDALFANLARLGLDFGLPDVLDFDHAIAIRGLQSFPAGAFGLPAATVARLMAAHPTGVPICVVHTTKRDATRGAKRLDGVTKLRLLPGGEVLAISPRGPLGTLFPARLELGDDLIAASGRPASLVLLLAGGGQRRSGEPPRAQDVVWAAALDVEDARNA